MVHYISCQQVKNNDRIGIDTVGFSCVLRINTGWRLIWVDVYWISGGGKENSLFNEKRFADSGIWASLGNSGNLSVKVKYIYLFIGTLSKEN